jgi:hypothetical protein
VRSLHYKNYPVTVEKLNDYIKKNVCVDVVDNELPSFSLSYLADVMLAAAIRERN